MMKTIRVILGLSWLLFSATALWAGDCSSADDCSRPPDNASKAVVVVSIFAGAGLAYRSMNGQKEEVSEEEELDVPESPGPLDTPGNSSSATNQDEKSRSLPPLGEEPPEK